MLDWGYAEAAVYRNSLLEGKCCVCLQVTLIPWASLLLTSQRQNQFFKVTLSGIGWDNDLPGDVKNDWKIWIRSMEAVANYSTPRYCFSDGVEITSDGKFFFQLHGSCDASNYALSCAVYLRCLVNRKLIVAFIPGKSKLVLANQRNWVKSRKELEAATLCADLMLSVFRSLQYFKMLVPFCSNSQVTLKWTVNPDLDLPRFVKQRVDKILLVASADAWNYIHSSVNPADVGTGEASAKTRIVMRFD